MKHKSFNLKDNYPISIKYFELVKQNKYIIQSFFMERTEYLYANELGQITLGDVGVTNLELNRSIEIIKNINNNYIFIFHFHPNEVSTENKVLSIILNEEMEDMNCWYEL